MNQLLKEAIELLKFRIDPQHSKRPSADDIRSWIDRCKAHIVQQDTIQHTSVGIYMVDSSRINVAGINGGNVDHFMRACAAVLSA